ncbi:hypothetical protein P6U16_09625 [Rhizobium sp. 32-5/1]|uniref:hypothetical protein n=1 Tax=Rhizobium sp. 32-5/1 TaxID=3019602 RepID=UPI00240DF3A2|nr:hypothetical protein [Rhizobium sp. 32-5/1]WEZ84780.1 hypothetical protein P6U16_09625 [Rhizobium sp. 32-5/1]
MAAITRLFVILALLIPPSFASAQDSPEDVEELAGHQIVIDGPFSEHALSIDGRKVHEDAFIAIQHRGSIDDVDFLVGTSSAGGNACEGSPFVISATADGEATFEGPIDSCAFMNVTIEKDRVLFATDPLPDRESERWEWAPGAGIRQIANEAFVADTSKGWAEVESASHPSELMGFGDLSPQIDDLLGQDRQTFAELIVGIGSGTFENGYFVGTACPKFICLEAGAMIATNPEEQTIYLAWKPEGEEIIVRPAVGEWPKPARLALRDWAAQWE